MLVTSAKCVDPHTGMHSDKHAWVVAASLRSRMEPTAALISAQIYSANWLRIQIVFLD